MCVCFAKNSINQCVGGGGSGLLRVCRSALSATMRLRRRRRPRPGAEAARTSQCLRCCGASRHAWRLLRLGLGAALLDAVHDSSSTSALVAITAAELPILQHERSAVSTGAASTGSNLFCSLSQQRDKSVCADCQKRVGNIKKK